jgi:hypothetical protein
MICKKNKYKNKYKLYSIIIIYNNKMSLNQLINPVNRIDIKCDKLDCNELTGDNTLIDNLEFKAQNGDIINLSSLADKGIGGYRLTSDGDGSVSWVAGAGSSGVDYNGTDPVVIGKLAIYGATNGKLIKESTLSDTDILNKNGDTMNGNLDMNGNALFNVKTITGNGSDAIQILNGGDGVEVFVDKARIQSVNNIELSAGVNNISCESKLNMNSNDIDSVGNIEVITLDGLQLISGTTTQDLVLNNGGGNKIKITNCNLDLDNNSIENVNNIQNVSNVYVENIYGALGTINMNNEVDLGTELIKGNIAQFNNLSSYNTLDDILINNNLNLNQVELKDAKNLEIKNPPTSQGNTKFITDVSQLPTAIGGFHLLEDNTSYIICGQITLTNGIQYGNNCSLSGIDFSASITFDETLNDIVGFKSVDTNVYLSKLTIIGGGGRFSGVPSFTNGLFNCDDFDVAGGFPFYGRNRRFKVDGCNFITPYSMGRVRGYATLNFNNNLISGTATFDTYQGLECIDGLSLEFLGNKIVLFRGGADANSPAKMLRFGASIVVPVIPQKPEGLMGFNAVNCSGCIFHPRGNFENGIDFDPTSRTGLGVISSNTFIRSGGTSPLINYENQASYDNYNPFSVETYSISSNVGVVNSEPNLKSIIQLSNNISSTTLTKLVCQDNNQVEPIDESSRFAIKLELTGVSSAFVGNEIITDDASGETALILFAESLIATTQIVYITDMSGKFNAIPTTFTGSVAGASTGGSLFFYWRYSEKDPRKLILTANFDLNVNNNVGFSVAPNIGGVADTLCSVSSVSASAGAGSTLSVVCSKKYVEGDFVEFYASSTAGNINLVKSVITII